MPNAVGRPRRELGSNVTKSQYAFRQWVHRMGGVLPAAQRLEITTGYVSRLQNGERKPGRSLSQVIDRVTRRLRGPHAPAAGWDA